MAKNARPAGRKPVDKIKPPLTSQRRDSSGPSTPRATAPKPGKTPGGEPKTSGWGQHLQ
jgi:hypothetical protein